MAVVAANGLRAMRAALQAMRAAVAEAAAEETAVERRLSRLPCVAVRNFFASILNHVRIVFEVFLEPFRTVFAPLF